MYIFGPIVYRLGHLVLIQESGVRFSVGPQRTNLQGKFYVAGTCNFRRNYYVSQIITQHLTKGKL